MVALAKKNTAEEIDAPERRIAALVRRLYPLNRTLVGPDTDKALAIIGEALPGLTVHAIASGTKCWTWTVPQEWLVHDAFVADARGAKIVSFQDSPLMVASYSQPVDAVMKKSELAPFVATAPKQPQAFPFVFRNYYRPGWGVSIPYARWSEMLEGDYRVVIKSEFRPGDLKIGEFRLPGKSDKMITLIADICHPAQVNDSITGVAAAIEVARQIAAWPERYYTYQFLFLPETIGSIAYLSQNPRVIPQIRYACFSEMLGTKGELVLQKSRQGNAVIDLAAFEVFGKDCPQHAFREGVCNDEMVFNGPGINIPTISLTRCFDPVLPFREYHTSLDTPEILDFSLVRDAAEKIVSIFSILDRDYVPRIRFTGPVFLTAYDMFVSQEENPTLNLLQEKIMLALEDGHSVLQIACSLDMDFDELWAYLERYCKNGLIDREKI